jgi:hypothetical protein
MRASKMSALSSSTRPALWSISDSTIATVCSASTSTSS